MKSYFRKQINLSHPIPAYFPPVTAKMSSHIVLKLDADIKVYKYFSFKVYIIFISHASRMRG